MIDIAAAAPGVPRPRVLLVAGPGGHFEQLQRLAAAGGISEDSQWVTSRAAQTEFLEATGRATFIPMIQGRDWLAALRSVRHFRSILRDTHFDAVVSTGAAIAVPAFIAAQLAGVPTLYVESVSRVEGPSLTGRIVSSTRLARQTWTQHAKWSSRRWRYHGQVLELMTAVDRGPTPLERLFITLGTAREFRFDALVDGVLATGAANDKTVWQLGATSRDNLPGESYDFISSNEWDAFASKASVVITSSGVGSVLRLLDMGIFPILVIRRASRGEHVDDHQAEIANLMASRGLGMAREADEITVEDLEFAARKRIVNQGASRQEGTAAPGWSSEHDERRGQS